MILLRVTGVALRFVLGELKLTKEQDEMGEWKGACIIHLLRISEINS